MLPSALLLLWEHRDSNPGPSACKADALNQLSYTPSQLRSGLSVLSRGRGREDRIAGAKIVRKNENANFFALFRGQMAPSRAGPGAALRRGLRFAEAALRGGSRRRGCTSPRLYSAGDCTLPGLHFAGEAVGGEGAYRSIPMRRVCSSRISMRSRSVSSGSRGSIFSGHSIRQRSPLKKYSS